MFFVNNILAVIGIVGGLLCAIADLLLDLKGPNNIKNGIIDSEWENMSHWRFVISGILAMFAVPMYSCGFVALMNKMTESYQLFPGVLSAIFLIGAMGGFMIHIFLCLQPTIYQKLSVRSERELAKELIYDLFAQIYIPFFTLYCMLVIVPSIVVMGLIINGILILPVWCLALNPLVFQVIGLLLRGTGLKMFIDAPSCCAASLGLAMYGVLALML